MTYKTKNTAKLGLFIFVGSILFIIAIYLIGTRKNMFVSTLNISSIFANANGLQPGNNVRYAGINVGTVDKVILLNDSTVQVKMKLNENVQDNIRKDAVASIGSDGLVGSMLVNISPGKGEAEIVEDGDTLDSYSRVETDELLNTLGKTNENIALISNNLLEITNQIRKGKGTLSLLLRDNELADQLSNSIQSVELTSYRISQASKQLQDIMTEVNEGQGLLNQLLTDTTLIPEVRRSITGVDSMFREGLKPTLSNMEQSTKDISEASQELNQILNDLKQGEGTAGLLLRDEQTAQTMSEILENLETGTARFSENMKAMREHFLFRGYFRRKEKEKN